MTSARVRRSFSDPHIRLFCPCGWEGNDDDIKNWHVEHKRDRVVRVCPGCGEPVPEWGALQPIEGAEKIARGSLLESIKRENGGSESATHE